MQTVRKVFNLLQLSKIGQLTVSFAPPEQEKCSLLRGKKKKEKKYGLLVDKTDWYTLRIWRYSRHNKSVLIFSFFVHSHRTCLSSSFSPGQNRHEKSDPRMKRNLCTLTQDTPALNFSNASLKLPFIEHTYSSRRKLFLKFIFEKPAVWLSFSRQFCPKQSFRRWKSTL